MAAHAVGDDEESRADVRGVLVVGADQAHVGAGGGAQGQGHGALLPQLEQRLADLDRDPDRHHRR